MRRFAAFCLTILLLLTTLTTAYAADRTFHDYSEIQNRSAVTLLVDLGLVSGANDGTFRPGASITRAETAKLLALLRTEEPEDRNDVWFSDVEGHWAAPYIRFCASEGILTGDGHGSFRPDDPVTGQELAKMLLVVVGNAPSRYSGRGWAEAVDSDAEDLGLYAKFTKDPSRKIDRDDACLLIYNAIQCWAIAELDENGDPLYMVDELRNPITFLEARFGVVRYTGVLTGNQYADLSGSGALDEGVTKLAGHKEFQVETDLSLLGQCVDVYVRDGQVVGVPCPSTTAVSYIFKSKAEMEELCRLTGYEIDPEAAWYLNYKAANLSAVAAKGDVVAITALDQNGDKIFEQISTVTYTHGVVEDDSPLTVRIGGSTCTARPMQLGDAFEKGQDVLCVQVNGTWYVK